MCQIKMVRQLQRIINQKHEILSSFCILTKYVLNIFKFKDDRSNNNPEHFYTALYVSIS